MNKDNPQELDFLEMPLEGVAAYWLSLKKIMGNKVVPKTMQEEVANADDAYVKYLLDICLSGFDDLAARRAGLARRDNALAGMRVRMGLMREALLSICAVENPRMTLMRLGALLPMSTLSDEGATKMALEMVRTAEKSKDGYVVTVDMKLSLEQLMVKLLFYVLWSRRGGKAELEGFAENGRCRYFNQGLTMVADGLESGFILSCLDAAEREILDAVRIRMDLALEMALALRSRTSYDDMYRIAQAYMP